MEATEVSIDRWIDTVNEVYTDNGIFFGFKKMEILTCATTYMNLGTL